MRIKDNRVLLYDCWNRDYPQSTDFCCGYVNKIIYKAMYISEGTTLTISLKPCKKSKETVINGQKKKKQTSAFAAVF